MAKAGQNITKIQILEDGDQAIGFSENKLAVKKLTGEVEIFLIEFDENKLPRISSETLLITFKKGKNNAIIQKKKDITVGTY